MQHSYVNLGVRKERLVNNEIWPTDVLVCSRCYEVMLLSYPLHTPIEGVDMILQARIVNQGDGTCVLDD